MIGWIDQHGNTSGLGHQVMEKSQPLGRNLSSEKIDSGRVAARPGKAGDKAKPDRVFADAEDDWGRCGRGFGRLGTNGQAGRGDNGHATADEVSHERRQAIVPPIQPVVLDHHVLALDVAGFVEAFTERGGLARGGIGRANADESDNREHRLLRPRLRRPRRRAAEKRDELAAPHSITSSARASNVAGTSRPSALAVLRLMTSSYFVGACTGRSAGL